MTTIAVHTDHLTRTFGAFNAVDQVSLEVPAGTVYGFLGPNGAGKTTTIGIILGLLHATSGQVRIFGEPVTPTYIAPLQRVGSLVGSVGMEPHLSARQNLHLLRYLHPTVERRRIDVVLDQVGLLHAADRRIAASAPGSPVARRTADYGAARAHAIAHPRQPGTRAWHGAAAGAHH